MLEKNKDYVEMRVSSTDCAFTQNSATKICVDGYVYTTYMNLPDPGELYILISKEKFDQLQTENEQLKKKLHELEKEIEVYSRALQEWKKITGCPSPSAAKSLIESGASWHHAYRDVKAANEKLADSIKAWKNVTGYSIPEDYMHARLNLAWQDATGELICGRDLRHNLQVDLEYYRALSSAQAKSIYSWREATGCSTPEEAKTLIESGMSYVHGYHEAQKENRKLTEEVDSWKNTTGYSTPEDYMHARISGTFHTPFDYTAAWQKATGRIDPEAAKQYIDRLKGRLNKIHGYSVDW